MEFAAGQASEGPAPATRAAYDVPGPGRIAGMSKPAQLCGIRATGRSAGICLRLPRGRPPMSASARRDDSAV
jgi:hypothetical protein